MSDDPVTQRRRLSQTLETLLIQHAMPGLVLLRDRAEVATSLSTAAEAEAWIRDRVDPLIALANALRQHACETGWSTRRG